MLKWWGDWTARRRRYSRDELIRGLQEEIDRLRSELTIVKDALRFQVEINRRDRERVAAEHAGFSRQVAGGGMAEPVRE